MAASSQNITTILPPPNGYIVDFDNPQQFHTGPLYVVPAVGFVLALSVLLMRLYTRYFLLNGLAIDDYIIVASFMFSIVVQSMGIHLTIVKVIGVHAWEMSIDDYNYYSLMIMLMSTIYVPCLGCAKMSILLLYRRLSPVPWFRACIYVVMSIVLSYSIGIIFALLFPCQPVAKNWDVTITDGHCADKASIYLATAGVNIATDVLILLLPIPMVWKLQMPKLTKIGLCLLFAVGSTTCITSVVRLVYLIPMLSNLDQTSAVAVPLVWIYVEANLVIFCCCLPTLRSFLRHFAPRLIGERSSGNSNDNPVGKVPYSTSGNKTIGQITARSMRKDRAADASLMSKSEENLELASVDQKARLDDGSDKNIWQTKSYMIS